MSRRKQCDPTKDPTSLGNICLNEGWITLKDFDAAVREFKTRNDVMLGEFLVERDLVSTTQIELALLKQKRLRNGGKVSHKMVLQVIDIATRSQDENARTLLQSSINLSATLAKIGAK